MAIGASRIPGPAGCAAYRQCAAPARPDLLLRGDFTMLKYVEAFDARALERRLGFHRGRLSAGYDLMRLAPGETLRPEDFELGASTRWSGGVMTTETGQLLLGGSAGAMLELRGQDVNALKARVAAFFARGGGNTPAKVLPRQRHHEGMAYPDATALDGLARSGVPQFKLLRPRRFVLVRSQP